MDIFTAPVALLIFCSTILISLYSFYYNPQLIDRWVLRPYSVVYGRKWHLLISSGFIHSNFSHLAFNMMTFFFFAFALENRIDSMNFFIIYFAGMILSDIPTVMKKKNDLDYRSLGASGAISAVLFSYILLFPATKLYIFIIPLPIPAPIFGILYLAYCWYAARKANDFINHEAHFWGAVTGIILTMFLIPNSINDFIDAIF